MKRYEEYKDSGVEWIGEIPEGWEVTKIKYKANLYPKCDINKIDKSNMVTFTPMECVKTGSLEIRATEFSNYNSSYNVFKNGDILLAKVTPCFENKNIVIANGLIGGIGFGSSELFVFRCGSNTETKFLYYYFQTNEFINFGKSTMYGVAGLKRVNSDLLINRYLAIPPIEEQNRIVDFIDNQTLKIDFLISDKQKLINLLKEKRQAIISEAVTKGIDKNVKMKDSGVEWIGEIPNHWKTMKLRYIGSCQNGLSKAGEFFGSGYPFVSYSDVYKNIELPQNVEGLVESSIYEREHCSVQKGDVFFTRTSETVEEIALASTCMSTIPNATFAGFLIRFRPNSNDLNPGFSKYYFSSQLHRSYFVKEMNLVTRASLNQELLKNLIVIMPPKDEQEKISFYIDSQLKKIDTLITDIQLQIEKLKEYRQSLISEVVTGKVAI